MDARESTCYRLMQSGLTTAEIAVAMNVKRNVAETLRKRVNRQIGIAERDRLANRASVRYRRGLESRRSLRGAN